MENPTDIFLPRGKNILSKRPFQKKIFQIPPLPPSLVTPATPSSSAAAAGVRR